MSDEITVFGANGRGGHNVGVRGATIVSGGPEDDARCVSLAQAVLDAEGTLAVHAAQIAARDAEIERLRAAVGRAAAERNDALATIEAAASGRRRFNGPVLCKPARAGEWGGPVWLLDPEKQERGFGLCFDSLADVRRAHPELWVASVADDGVLLDASPLASLSGQVQR